MIISGIAATVHADIGGYVLLGNAIDTTKRVKLCFEHGREIGDVTHLQYIGNDLYITAETDDETALKLDYFSVAGHPIERAQHGKYWHVSRFGLTEISLVKTPANDRCVVIDRKPSDPFRAWQKTRTRQIDLFSQAFEALHRDLQQVIRTIETRP